MNERKLTDEINFLLNLDYKNIYTGTLRNPQMETYVWFSEIIKKFYNNKNRTTLGMVYNLYKHTKWAHINGKSKKLLVKYSNILEIINNKRKEIENGK